MLVRETIAASPGSALEKILDLHSLEKLMM
jgi:hypothetical protein